MYFFNIQQLMPFDIVLIRFPDDTLSKAIRRYCKSDYSHAIVYLGNSSFVEAFPPIVTLFSAQRYYFNNLNDVKVLRLKIDNPIIFDSQKAELAIRSLVYCNYSDDLLSYIKSRNIPIEIINRFKETNNWTGGIICSSLVTLPYYVGGIDISNGDEPYYTHFGHIEKSQVFEDVTLKVFIKENNEIADDTFDYFSLKETGSILEKQSTAVKRLNDLVEKIYQELGNNPKLFSEMRIEEENLIFSNWEDIFPNIMRWFLTSKGKEIDESVYAEIRDSEYNNLWFEEVHNNPRLFFPLYSIYMDTRHYKLEREPIEYFQMIKTSLERTLLRIEQNKDVVDGNFFRCPCKTYHVLLDMYSSYTNLLELSINQYDRIISAKENNIL